MLGAYADAEDTVQETLERAWRAHETYRADAPLEHWLFTIATNACLNELKRRQRRSLPQLTEKAAGREVEFGEREPERFLTPGPDRRLNPDPEQLTEGRETVTLAFLALLQRLPPKQRAVVLMKDVLGWSADEISQALELSSASVNSALHRARQGLELYSAEPRRPHEEPTKVVLESFVRAWEQHDLEALVALMRQDITLAMPPHAAWFSGVGDVVAFLESARFAGFWRAGLRLIATRSNGFPAFAFYRRAEDGTFRPHSILVARFLSGAVAEMTVFLGSKAFAQFDLPATLERTI